MGNAFSFAPLLRSDRCVKPQSTKNQIARTQPIRRGG